MNINRKKEIEHPAISPSTPVTVKMCGNITEIRYMQNAPSPAIQKLDKDYYLNLRTGEVRKVKHKSSRAGDPASVSQSLRNLRDIINTNLTNPECALWVTLTYRENMRDVGRLYEDYRRFWSRFQYHLRIQGHPKAEYISAVEPQGRGAWHLHTLFLFPEKAPYIPNQKMAQLWGHGFTKTKGLQGIDNPGLYLTAYLGDMELEQVVADGILHKGRVVATKSGSKAVVKGARLHLYPAGINLYRCSKGIKRPETYSMTEREAQEYIGKASLVYEKTIEVVDKAGSIKNRIYYRQYNKMQREGKVLQEGIESVKG